MAGFDRTPARCGPWRSGGCPGGWVGGWLSRWVGREDGGRNEVLWEEEEDGGNEVLDMGGWVGGWVGGKTYHAHQCSLDRFLAARIHHLRSDLGGVRGPGEEDDFAGGAAVVRLELHVNHRVPAVVLGEVGGEVVPCFLCLRGGDGGWVGGWVGGRRCPNYFFLPYLVPLASRSRSCRFGWSR